MQWMPSNPTGRIDVSARVDEQPGNFDMRRYMQRRFVCLATSMHLRGIVLHDAHDLLYITIFRCKMDR